ncbi:hypothetical protein [Streptacidiphilus sp. P02-A3a]|uniref:hypothetical protein n=1 Tax=Streptacidiphilus sp. P02-A3a TaxID=2704468 RepID=UPI0015FBBB11|nr:hypothetical protein [Streptacidiphilus sp. P02-A3a]QMU70530.1 hypothetical protein GXP74_22345 [Streptacidiphilus sp. P02-A3a]
MIRATGGEAPPQETVRPGSDPLETAETDRRSDPDDHLRHIVCMTCYPEFEGTQEAPRDAVCVCGKRIRKGDRRNRAGRAHCILCDELWAHHNATAHP